MNICVSSCIDLPATCSLLRPPLCLQDGSVAMAMEEQRSNREDLLRQQRQAQDRVRRIDDSKMRRLQVGTVFGCRAVDCGVCMPG